MKHFIFLSTIILYSLHSPTFEERVGVNYFSQINEAHAPSIDAGAGACLVGGLSMDKPFWSLFWRLKKETYAQTPPLQPSLAASCRHLPISQSEINRYKTDEQAYTITYIVDVADRSGTGDVWVTVRHHAQHDQMCGTHLAKGTAKRMGRKSNREADGQAYTITYIVDGDTFYARNPDGSTIKFRPIGINCPETGKRNGKPEAFHQEATDYTTAMLLNKKVRVEYDVQKQDRYGRELVYVYLEDGTFFNEAIVRAGWAVVATYPPNVAHVETFITAQKEAREQGRGMWGVQVSYD